MGAGKQRLYVIPSLDMVVVRQAETTQFEDGEFLSRLLLGKASLPDVVTNPNQRTRRPPLRWFARLDLDGDGQLSDDEIPERLRDRLLEADADKDGIVSRNEVVEALAR